MPAEVPRCVPSVLLPSLEWARRPIVSGARETIDPPGRSNESWRLTTEPDDRELVKRCKAGDQEAFKELVERYRDVVFGLITRTTLNPARSEELAQEAFLRVYRGLPYFRGEARLTTWIYRIVANLCIEERGRRAVVAVSLDEVDEHQQPRIQPGGPDRAFSDFELRDRLATAMHRLSPRYRFLIAAHYLKDVRYEDLADALGVPLGTVKTQLHRARHQLRGLLERQRLESSRPAASGRPGREGTGSG